MHEEHFGSFNKTTFWKASKATGQSQTGGSKELHHHICSCHRVQGLEVPSDFLGAVLTKSDGQTLPDNTKAATISSSELQSLMLLSPGSPHMSSFPGLQ